jgi:hypothetical protein
MTTRTGQIMTLWSDADDEKKFGVTHIRYETDADDGEVREVLSRQGRRGAGAAGWRSDSTI